MNQYRAKQGDMIDAICKNYYGNEDMLEKVYDANPGLAALGPILPMGTIVILPEISTQSVKQPIRLWSKSSAG